MNNLAYLISADCIIDKSTCEQQAYKYNFVIQSETTLTITTFLANYVWHFCSNQLRSIYRYHAVFLILVMVH